MSECAVDLYWLPVGAGTSRLQQASLRLWEAFEAARARRSRCTLLHAALKLRLGDRGSFTFELTPAFLGSPVPPLLTGPVGVRGADRFTLFRYQLQCIPGDTLPDEEWAIAGPIPLTADCVAAQQILELAPTVPAHVWGRRVRGTREMWTSDSIVSWLLIRAGIDMARLQPPLGCRAPGWQAGIDLALRSANR